MSILDTFKRWAGIGPARDVSEARSGPTPEQLGAELALIRESFTRLELELEQAGWQRQNQDAGAEPSRQATRMAANLARLSWLKNPLIRRAIDLQASYVFAQGLTIGASNEPINKVIQDFLKDPQNLEEIWGHLTRGQKDRELSMSGNLFLVLFVNVSSGAVKVGSIYDDEIDRVICDPENKKKPRYYHPWTAESFDEATGAMTLKSFEAYYPDWRYSSANKPDRIGGFPVRWESPVMHIKVGGLSNWKLGFSEVEVARPYATGYKDFLADWLTIAKSLSRFSWDYKGSQSAAETAAAKSKLGTTYGSRSVRHVRNESIAGTRVSVAILPPGRDLTPIKTAGVAISAEDGRQVRLMAIAPLGFGDHFFGDTSQGALATAKSLDRPTELRIADRQALWTNVFRQLVEFVLLWAVQAPSGPLAGMGQIIDPDGAGPGGAYVAWGSGIDATVSIDWPPIIEQDLLAYMQALSLASQALPAELVAQLMMSSLRVHGIDKWLAELKKNPIQPAQQAARATPPVPEPNRATAAKESMQPDGDAMLAAALSELKAWIERAGA